MSLSETAALVSALQKELRRVIVGQDEVIDEILTAFLAGGHCLLRGVPGLAKTLLIKTLAEAVHLKFSRIQFTPDLMPSDITGTEVIEEDRATGYAQHPVHARADLRQHHPRRRDQPHAAEDAGGAARGDAGVSGHRRRRAPSARAAALRAGDAESDRAGGHLSAARSAARSLHAQRRDRLPDARRTSGTILAQTTTGAGADGDAGRDRRTDRAGAACWCAMSSRPTTSSTTRRGSCARRGRRGDEARSRAGFREAVGAVGRRAARRPVAAARGQGEGGAATAGRPCRSRTSARWRRRCCAIASWSTSRPKPTASMPRQVVTRLLDAVSSRARAMSRPHVVDLVRAAVAARSRADDAGDGRRSAAGAASQSVSRLQRRVQPVSPLSARRRPEVRRLESVRADRSPLHAPVPRDDQPVGAVRARRQPVDGLSAAKFELARSVTAILGTLVLDQGDAAGVLAVDDRAHFVPPRSGHHHLRVFLAAARRAAAAGRVVDRRCAARAPRRSSSGAAW